MMAITETTETTETVGPRDTGAAAVITDVEAALSKALHPSAHSNAEGVATLVRSALDAHR